MSCGGVFCGRGGEEGAGRGKRRCVLYAGLRLALVCGGVFGKFGRDKSVVPA